MMSSTEPAEHVTPPAATTSPREEIVAPLLEPTAELPAPARRINFFVALLGYWIVPKRLGPHLAVAAWWRALLAHVLSVISAAAIAVLVLGDIEDLLPGEGLPLRQRLAHFVLDSAVQSGQRNLIEVEFLLVLLAVPAFEFTLFLLAILLMPFYAGGDRAGSVFRRSMKNSLWSTTIFVPAMTFYVFMLRWMRTRESRLPIPEALEITLVLVVMLAPIAWWIRMLFVGGREFVGEPDGPAFAPREPHCDDCGYLIVHLPLSKRCPECGLRVAESLPGGRRQPTAWQQHKLNIHGLRAYFVTLRHAIARRGFFQTLPVQSGFAKAQHFWWLTCGLLIMTNFAIVVSSAMFSTFTGSHFESRLAMAVLGIPLLLGLQAMMSFGVCLWGQWRHGIRDYRNSAIVCYYGAALIWPWWILLSITEGFLLSGLGVKASRVMLFTTNLMEFTLAMLIGILLAMPMLGAGVWWLVSLTQGLKQIRFANV